LKRLSIAIFQFILLLVITGCSSGYNNDGQTVYYNHWNEGNGQHHRQLDADPKTFRILEFSSYAKDEKTVYYEGQEIIGADAASFVALGDCFGKDKHYGWYGKDTIKTSCGSSFTVINDHYSKDGFDVFYNTEPLHMTEPANFRFVAGEGEYQSWTTDGNNYFFNNYKIPSDDYAHVTIYPKSSGLAKDLNRAYFLDHALNNDITGKRVVDTIDVASFEVTGYMECKDKYGCINVYHGREDCDE